MSYLIDTCFAPNIKAIQTTKTLGEINDFDVHPEQFKKFESKQLRQHFSLPHDLKLQKQEHKNRVIEYTSTPKVHFQHRADACFTRKKSIICAVMTADCLPVLLADQNGQWVAAIHCGWRSLYQNIITHTFKKTKANPRYTQAYLGPCIQKPNYQVDQSFIEHFTEKHPFTQPAFTTEINGKCHADLQAIARIELEQIGIRNIKASTDCTYNDVQTYHSWRRNQSPNRMATLVWIET